MNSHYIRVVNYRRESALKCCKDTLKVSLRDFDIPMGSVGEQTAQERSKWRGLINKVVALYEGKRICEAERNRRKNKAKANDSMTLTFYFKPTV